MSAQDDLAEVIERSEKSVVRIEVKGKREGAESLGSGFVVSEDGILVTNVHVLAGAKEAVAIFPNGSRYKLVGVFVVDEGKDICVAKLAFDNFVPISLAQNLPRKGETVIALGAPLGLSFTATTGIVSALRQGSNLGKDIGDKSMRGTWVQVDAALSPGNSGGPLINNRGQVVAMSTRASSGGRAQNLNFGISVVDINIAIREAQSAKLVPLVEGVGDLKGSSAAGGPGSYVKRKDVPAKSLMEYVSKGRESFDVLARGFRRYVSSSDAELKLMRKGRTYIPQAEVADSRLGSRPSPAPTLPEPEWVRRRGRSSILYYFKDETTKRRIVQANEVRVGELKALKKRVAGDDRRDALFALLSEYGPPVDTRRSQSIGFLDGAQVLHAFSDNEMAIRYRGGTYLMWTKSTAGLSRSQEVRPMPIFVAGTETIVIPGLTSVSVTVLQEVEKDMIKAAISDHKEFLTWRDKSGKYAIEAYLVKNDGVRVHLGKRDGSTIKVPLSKLDSESIKAAKFRLAE